jgi:pilus assembly protein Flp/PilA
VSRSLPRAFRAGAFLSRNGEEADMTLFKRFAKDTKGATAIEYALIASLIAVAIITAVQTVGTKVSTVFGEVGNSLH